MEQLIERCCGLDVHRDTVAACVRVPGPGGRRTQTVQTFGTTAADLLALRDWLEAQGVTHVAMESTGVYWKPVYYVLEEAFTCLLVNAAHLKHVPGRKTDVQDCAWIAQVLEHGLIRGSFVPPSPIRELRDLTRYRKSVIQERTRHANRIHKTLEDAGVKLAAVANDILGASGRAMLESLVQPTASRSWSVAGSGCSLSLGTPDSCSTPQRLQKPSLRSRHLWNTARAATTNAVPDPFRACEKRISHSTLRANGALRRKAGRKRRYRARSWTTSPSWTSGSSQNDSTTARRYSSGHRDQKASRNWRRRSTGSSSESIAAKFFIAGLQSHVAREVTGTLPNGRSRRASREA